MKKNIITLIYFITITAIFAPQALALTIINNLTVPISITNIIKRVPCDPVTINANQSSEFEDYSDDTCKLKITLTLEGRSYTNQLKEAGGAEKASISLFKVRLNDSPTIMYKAGNRGYVFPLTRIMLDNAKIDVGTK